MSEHATISADIIASYAADAAREVAGIRGLVESTLSRRGGVRVTDEEGRIAVELHLAVDWGVSIQDVGNDVQRHVAAYLVRMADVEPATVAVVIEEIADP